MAVTNKAQHNLDSILEMVDTIENDYVALCEVVKSFCLHVLWIEDEIFKAKQIYKLMGVDEPYYKLKRMEIFFKFFWDRDGRRVSVLVSNPLKDPFIGTIASKDMWDFPEWSLAVHNRNLQEMQRMCVTQLRKEFSDRKNSILRNEYA